MRVLVLQYLISNLSGRNCPLKYRVAIVEKAGYGWSEVTDVSRDIDVILEETRSALKLSGESPPYVLAPHSMSGLEAIRWAQKYPKEVQAIIGLDPAVPQVYQVLKIPPFFVQSIASAVARVGLLRLVPSVANNSDAIQSGELSPEEISTYKALFYRRTLTSNMLEEAKQVKANAVEVGKGAIPKDVPMYFFISDGTEVGVDNWQEILASYTNELDNGKHLYLNCGHYVHAWESELIAKEMDVFLSQIQSQK